MDYHLLLTGFAKEETWLDRTVTCQPIFKWFTTTHVPKKSERDLVACHSLRSFFTFSAKNEWWWKVWGKVLCPYQKCFPHTGKEWWNLQGAHFYRTGLHLDFYLTLDFFWYCICMFKITPAGWIFPCFHPTLGTFTSFSCSP